MNFWGQQLVLELAPTIPCILPVRKYLQPWCTLVILPAQKCGGSGLWLQRVPMPIAASEGQQGYDLYEV